MPHPVADYLHELYLVSGTGVPETSGYQVLKKWLSYRESALLGRPFTSDEAQQFTHHVRRIAAILAMGGELDAHYRKATPDST